MMLKFLFFVFNFFLKVYCLEYIKGGGVLGKLEFVNNRVWFFYINFLMWLVEGWKYENYVEK